MRKAGRGTGPSTDIFNTYLSIYVSIYPSLPFLSLHLITFNAHYQILKITYHTPNVPTGKLDPFCFISAPNRNSAHDLCIKSYLLLCAALFSKEPAV